MFAQLTGKLLAPQSLYMLLSGGYAFFFMLATSVLLIFQTREAGLNPFQLVLVAAVMEATHFVFEVPTGVLADAVSRRASVLAGLIFVGAGLVLGGAWARFEPILASQVLWGAGLAFLSGAKEAWIADEISHERARPVYMRSAQLELACRLAALPLGFGLATIELRLPILLGGALMFPLALFLWAAMPEQGFRPAGAEGRPIARIQLTLVSGHRLVRGNPLLLTMLAVTAFYGMASEGFERLWVAHFYENLSFPAAIFGPVPWLGVVRMGAAVFGIVALEAARRYWAKQNSVALSRGLFWIYVLQLAALVVFGLAGGFFVGMLAYWSVVGLARVYNPLYLAWINQRVDSSVRATVISMDSQVDAIGQVVGGPPMGALGSLVNLRAAFLGSAAMMSVSVPLLVRVLRLDKPQAQSATAGSAGVPEERGAESS